MKAAAVVAGSMVVLGAASSASAAFAAEGGGLVGLPVAKGAQLLEKDGVGEAATRHLGTLGRVATQAGGVLKKTSPAQAGKLLGGAAPIGGLPVGG